MPYSPYKETHRPWSAARTIPTSWFLKATSASPANPIFLATSTRSEEHTSELQSLRHLVCRLLREGKGDAVLSLQGDPPSLERGADNPDFVVFESDIGKSSQSHLFGDKY